MDDIVNTEITPEQSVGVVTRKDLAEAVRTTAVLVDLTVRIWSGERTDKKIGAKVKEDHGAIGDTGRYVKKLLAGADSELKSLKSAYAMARIKHKELTLPWGTESEVRLLPNLLFDGYCEKMSAYRKSVAALRDTFVANCPTLFAQAQANLGTMADAGDYPDPEEIRRSFKISFNFSPIPEAGAFQNLPEHTLESLSRSLKKRQLEAVEAAQAAMWERVRESVGHMVERLGDPDNRFKGATVESVRELITLLPGFNCAGDTRVASVVAQIEGMLHGVDAEEIRKDSTLRSAVAGQAQNILDRMQQWGI